VPALTDLVIFDCDGVLVDSERLSHEVLQQMLAERGVTIGFDDVVQRFIGTSLPTCLARVADLLGGPLPADFQARFAQRTRDAFAAGLTVVPGVEAVLDGLALPYCVASNGNRAKVEFTLGHTGLRSRFEGRIFTADDVLHPKPAPDLFLHAARRLGADPARTTVVEDTPTGITAARAAGMRTIGFAAMTPAARLQDAGADHVAHTMGDVQALLRATAQR
jgi:HAD superfamily hydrolase (TIGR01509 family)